MRNILILIYLSTLIALSFAMVPMEIDSDPEMSQKTPPEFPLQFYTNIAGQDEQGKYYGDWYFDHVAQRDRNDYWRMVGGVNQSEIFIDRYDLEESEGQVQAYFWCSWLGPSGVCDKEILVPPMNTFAVPKSSTFEGTTTLRSIPCDRWRYIWDWKTFHWITDYWVAYNKSNDYFYPLRIEYSGNQPHVLVDWLQFMPNSGTPESVFEIPPEWNCTFSERPDQREISFNGDGDETHFHQYQHGVYGWKRGQNQECPPVSGTGV